MTGLEDIRAALQEQHAEDVLFELGGVHLAAQDAGGGEQRSSWFRVSGTGVLCGSGPICPRSKAGRRVAGSGNYWMIQDGISWVWGEWV